MKKDIFINYNNILICIDKINVSRNWVDFIANNRKVISYEKGTKKLTHEITGKYTRYFILKDNKKEIE